MFTMIQTHGKVICYSNKLGLTAATRLKAMLMITEDTVMINVKKYKGVDYMYIATTLHPVRL